MPFRTRTPPTRRRKGTCRLNASHHARPDTLDARFQVTLPVTSLEVLRIEPIAIPARSAEPLELIRFHRRHLGQGRHVPGIQNGPHLVGLFGDCETASPVESVAKVGCKFPLFSAVAGAQGRNRTADTGIFSPPGGVVFSGGFIRCPSAGLLWDRETASPASP